MSVEYMGNIFLVIILFVLNLVIKEGKLNNGDIFLLYGFGGGFMYLGFIVEWNLI